MTTASTTGDRPTESGVLFPLVDGRRSTQTTSRAVFAEATRAVEPDLAHDIESSSNWHPDYVRRLGAIEAASARSAKNALLIAGDGLQAVHRHLVFARDDVEVPLEQALRTHRPGDVLRTATVTGGGDREVRLEIPYRGGRLTGPTLQRQLDQWVANGIVEAAFATAIAAVDRHPEWLDARDLTVVLVGAAAEMGPLPALSRWGATVVALDLRRPDVWERILVAVAGGAGTLHAPVRDPDDLAAAG